MSNASKRVCTVQNSENLKTCVINETKNFYIITLCWLFKDATYQQNLSFMIVYLQYYLYMSIADILY